jgi:hypothetical protein
VGLIAACLPGCWQDQSEFLDTAVARDKPLNSMTQQDLTSLCEAGGAAYSKLLGAGRANAYASAAGAVILARAQVPDAGVEGHISDLASCEQARERRVAMDAMQPRDWKTHCAGVRAPLGMNDFGCSSEATVSVYEHCLLASLHMLRADMDANATCAALDNKSLEEISRVPAPPPLPAECDLLHEPSLASCVFDVSRF